MDLTFDISEDELPIFLAETSEQFQSLDEGLVRLEREGERPDLIQTLFRAAHTLKGTAGMIGHKRMVELTHIMETALDGVRKSQVRVSMELIDACLEAVDILRLLSDEISTHVANPVDITPLVERLTAMASGAAPVGESAPAGPAGQVETTSPSGAASLAEKPKTVSVRAEISPDSIAPAARAFQLMLAIQELGEIVRMEPDQAEIENSAPVQTFSVEFIPGAAATNPSEIRRALEVISEVDSIWISGEVVKKPPQTVQIALAAAPGIAKDTAVLRLGDMLLQNGLISKEQLKTALEQQENETGPGKVLGHILVKMGMISQEVLDQVMAEQEQLRAAPTRSAEPGGDDRSHAHTAEKTIRTSVERLDNLMNLIGELITDRNRLYMLRGKLEGRYHGDNQVDTLSDTITHVGRITDQLQAEVMGIRMLPISNVFNKLPRLVRDLARKANKQVDLVVRGEDTELDRSVIEEVGDPLIHLLRNSLDHGLETPEERRAAGKIERGSILITARHEQGRIILTVEDDGRGINLEKVKAKAVEKGILTEKEAAALTDEEAVELIFVSGLSTAKKLSDVSGRGVGMDIVRNNIERLNGSIVVDTWPGKGSQFQIILPLTLAIVPTLLVRVSNSAFAIPLVTVTETLRVTSDEIQTINGRAVIRLRDHVLPVTRLANVLGLSHGIRASCNGGKHSYVVVVRSGKLQMGLIVDALVGEQEVVVKSLGSLIGEVTGISSAAILGDGQVALIVDVQGLFKLAAHNFTRHVVDQARPAAVG